MGESLTPSFFDGEFVVSFWQGFGNLDVNLNTNPVPRSDYYQNFNSSKTQSVKTITGMITANSSQRVFSLIQKLAKYHNQTKTFTISRFVDENGLEIINTATFEGVIKSILFEGQKTYNSCPFIITIVCEDPYYYGLERVVATKSIVFTGVTYPKTYPLTFGNTANLLTINNTGNTVATPIWKIKNQITNPKITNLKTNQVFGYSQSINPGTELVIDTKRRTAKISVNSKLEYITNIDELVLPVGISNFSFGGSNFNSDTQIEVSFFPKSNII